MDDQTLQLTTPRGPVVVTITPGATISIFTQTDAARDALTPGTPVLISGQPDDTGNLQASSITIIPESLGMPVGRPFGGRGGFGRGQ